MGEAGGTASAGKHQPTPPAQMELYLALAVGPPSTNNESPRYPVSLEVFFPFEHGPDSPIQLVHLNKATTCMSARRLGGLADLFLPA